MQYTINTGALPNDGTGTPLRTAFNDTNLNFNQIFAAGPVGSNIQISNNTILTTNTNGALILATNGTGAIVAAAAIQPDQANLRMIGAYNNRFNTVYSQYLDVQTATISGNMNVNGNLYVAGNTVTVDVANLDVANSVITVSANAPYAALADGSGLAVGGAGATFLYSATANAWNSNLPIEAPSFIGDGSQLTNVVANVDASAMSGNTINSNILYSSLTQVGTLSNLSVSGNVVVGQNILSNTITTGEITAIGFFGNGAGLTYVTGANVVGNVANATYATFAGTAGTANLAATATQAVNAQNAINALNAQTANTAQFADIANWANCADTATTAYQANSAVVAGYANTIGIQTSITVTGNIVTSAIKTNNYLFANGQPATFGGGTNYSNANVAAYLPIYSGNMLALGNVAVSGLTTLTTLAVTGNTTANGVSANAVAANAVFTNNYFYANGAPFTASGVVLGDQQFYGDGSMGPYTMTQDSTNNAVLVTINGLTQPPGTTYTVTGNLITFTETINVDEIVDIRFLGSSTSNNSANTGNIGFSGDYIYDLNGMTLENGDLSHGSTSALVLPSNGNTVTPTQLINTYGNLVLTAGTSPGNTSNWRFNNNGVLTFPDGTTTSGATTIAHSDYDIQSDGATYIQTHAYAGAQTWAFGTDGNLTLPGNTSSINYANGAPYASTYGNANVAAYLPTYTGNLNANLLYTGNVNPGSIPTNVGLVVDNGDSPTVIIGHYDPANVASHGYLQLVGEPTGNGAAIQTDSTFLNITNGGTDGIINIATGYLGSQIWTFDSAGNLTLPTNSSSINYANGQPYGGSGGSGNYGNANVAAYLPTYTGNLGNVGNISSTGNIFASGTVAGQELVALNALVLNSRTINANAVLDGFNASSVGPITTAPGVVIDIIDGTWLIS